LQLDLRRQPADHPIHVDHNGRGPTWNNSLFEDNAEFGLGFRVSIDKQREFAGELLRKTGAEAGRRLVHRLIDRRTRDEAGIYEQRERVEACAKKLGG
jgi:pyruvate-ferredoxin/flavodoxin oxidoreductase